MTFMTKMTENQAIRNLYSMFPVCIYFLMAVIYIISVISIFLFYLFHFWKRKRKIRKSKVSIGIFKRIASQAAGDRSGALG